MKYCCFIFFIGFTSLFYAQDKKADSLTTINTNEYIENHKSQFNVKFEISNNITKYKLPQEKIQLNIKPNLNAKYAFVLSYKFASIRIGIRPPVSDKEKENKGESKVFNMHFKLLFDHWSHTFDYGFNKGYYIVNTKDFIPEIPPSDFRIQFPNLTTNIFNGFSAYKLNKKYSVRAIESQTEIQLKSAGSFIPGIAYSFYKITGTNKVLLPEDNIFERETYSNAQGINLALTAGYYYTYVFRKYWFANANLIPFMGVDIYKLDKYQLEKKITSRESDIYFALNSNIGVGYNGKKFFFGADYAYRFSNEKFSENNIKLKITQQSFHVYFGYRFKAPKQVKKSIELIEKTVPILKETKNN